MVHCVERIAIMDLLAFSLPPNFPYKNQVNSYMYLQEGFVPVSYFSSFSHCRGLSDNFYVF